MKEKTLKPILVPKQEVVILEKDLIIFFQKNIYLPLIASLKESKKIYFNDNNTISSAIRAGNIQYADGIFKGQFDSKLSKAFRDLGLNYDKRIKGYRKELNNLPISIQIAIVQAENAYKSTAQNLISSIDNLLLDEALDNLDIARNFNNTINNIDDNFEKNTKAIGIVADLSKDNKRDIANNYANNTKLYIKDFAEPHILQLREEVQQAVLSGIRADELQQKIMKSYQVSASKAKFLAKQEISLFTSTYKQSKYTNAGINKYKWSISGVRTRPDHRALQGKIFSYDDPPITNKDTGARNNPGEDFGCNCIDIPIV